MRTWSLRKGDWMTNSSSMEAANPLAGVAVACPHSAAPRVLNCLRQTVVAAAAAAAPPPDVSVAGTPPPPATQRTSVVASL
jgi:hypothetical protein